MSSKNKWLVPLVLVLAGLLMAACATPEPEQVVVTIEVEGEGGETIVVTATPDPAAAEEEAEEPAEEEAAADRELTTFQTGIYEDLTSTNYWAVLDTEATTWNFYVNGNYKPAMYGLASQRFDWVPGIADGFPGDRTEEGDFVTIDVTLRDGLTWSDGEALTADDVVYTFDTIQAFELSSNWATYNPELFDHAEAVDDTTVRLFFTDVPGLGEWEFGVALAPIMAEHYWAPITDQIASDTGLAEADPEDAEAYSAVSAEARTSLYAHVPEDEPAYGPMMFGGWEPGAFAENVAREDYPDKGEVANLYENGAFELVRPDGEAFTAYGEASGDPYLSIETGPFVPGVIFSIYGSQDAAVLALLDGEIDYVFNPNGLSPGLFESVSAAEGITAIENPNYGFRYMAFNVRDDRPVTSDIAFRQAVATVVDQGFITDRILQGSAIPMWTVMPEANRFWYNPDIVRWGYDAEGNNLDRAVRIEQAVGILEDAGYSWDGEGVPTWNEDNQTADVPGTLLQPDGTPVPDMTILAPSAGYDPMRATAAIWLEQWMRELGIPVTAELTGFNNISDQVFAQQDAQWDMYILGWGLGNPAYPTYFESFWASQYDTETTGGFNTPGYANEEFDQLMSEFLAATDLDEAQQMIFEAQVILNEELPYITLFTTPLLEAYRQNVEFPFTDGLGGIEFYYGMQGTVRAYTAE